MNKGSALKWIDHIKTKNYPIASGQLRYDVDGIAYFDPLGSLCDFIDPNGWHKVDVQGFGWIGCYAWNGEKFKLHQDIIKRCKMKGPWGEFITENGCKMSISDVLSWDQVCYYIERYYEQM